MSGLIDRIQERTGTPDERPRVLDVDDADTDEVLDALSSDTGRALYRTLFDQPGTASEIARRCDTSVQNVHYHLSNLEAAGLVESIDTVYSEKGNEMTVYGPASDPIVLVGNHDLRPRLRQSLTDVVAGVGLLGLASLFVQWGAESIANHAAGGVLGPASPNAPQTDPAGSIAWFVFEVAEPGLLFFFGCLTLLAVVALTLGRRDAGPN
ncbi:helix-turn-helix domain-containing protein [Halomicroarcula sp. F13]|uniref:Helix-turn-helix domain-containing protein n=1 Tax=Haloarcula rubra TaxID=2487747 RepID=A0AAW4PLQ7_9EURY|nr:helix-turn-helix domain-containing protein [Halomicroarcula rubra]MBX0322007.1 helix-turn-helix domain-containing protein [Halomicroarcula rubra]